MHNENNVLPSGLWRAAGAADCCRCERAARCCGGTGDAAAAKQGTAKNLPALRRELVRRRAVRDGQILLDSIFPKNDNTSL
jgi:hypothetical protein